MKKYYFFAALATVGLFASCSSDEDFNEAEGARLMSVVDDSQAAPITIGVKASATRGTGTVGDITGQAANTWAGQKFNLFMYEKGTFTPAQYIPTQGANPEDIFNNAEMIAPDGTANGNATYEVLLDPTDPTSGTAQYNYYPATGSYSFWAYRIDDAGTGTNNVGVPAMYDATGAATTTEADAMTVKVPFVIDGSQDLMIGVADTAAAATALNTADDKIATDEAAAEKIYSAYAARRGVNPTLQFQHLLTRLTFQVKAAAKDVSSEAVAPVPAITGWEKGFKVTSIVVRSKSEGNIIAAWKGDAADYDEKSERIEWTSATEDWATPATLAPLSLMSRQFAVDSKADIQLVSVYADATAAVTIPTGYEDNLHHTGSINPSTLTAAEKSTYVVYTTNGLNTTTGLPTGTKTYLSEVTGHTLVYIPCYNSTPDPKHTAVSKTMAEPVYKATADANQPLVTLEPVVPGWNGVDAVLGAETEFTATAAKTAADNYAALTTTTVLTENAPYANSGAFATSVTAATADGNYKAPTTDGKYYTLTVTSGNVSNVVEITATAGQTAEEAYDAARGTNASITGMADLAAAKADAKKKTALGTYYYATNDSKFYAIPLTTLASPNNVKTNVGEALLVAPADEHGYRVEITYTRTKKINSTTVQPLSDTAVINVVRNANVSGTPTPVAFEAGKSYNVVITLYSDGETTSDTDLQGWEDGDGLDDSYDAE